MTVRVTMSLVLVSVLLTIGCLPTRHHGSTTPEESSGGAAQAPSNSGGNSNGPPLAVNPASVAGPRVYCIWADPAAERATQVLVQMGYTDAHFAEDNTRVFTLAPRNGYSLQVELANLIGSTRVNATTDSNSQAAQSAVAEFYSRFEHNLHQDECRH